MNSFLMLTALIVVASAASGLLISLLDRAGTSGAPLGYADPRSTMELPVV